MLKKAFSLIELSIAIIVISILIVGFLNVSSGKSSNNKVKITKDRIDVIYKSLGEFVLKNKRLPCPASIKAIKTSDVNYGIEGTAAGTCTAGTGVYLSTATNATKMVYGMVPTQTLGLSSDYGEDNFGNKIAYIVDKDYTSSTTFASANTGIIGQKYVNGALTTDVSNAIYALVSYGANQSGAFSAKTNNQNATSSDVDEGYNYPTSFNDIAKTANFSQILVKNTERSTVFDDIIHYRNRDDFLKDNNAGNIVNGNINSNANVTSVAECNASSGAIIDNTTLPGTKIFRFNTVGNYTFTCTASRTVKVLVVAGGGGGGGDAAGGGGGGEVVYNASYLASTSNSVTVGSGGIAGVGNNSVLATNGGDSVFGTIRAIGGGFGGRYNNSIIGGYPGNPGGSGGGGGFSINYAGGAGGGSTKTYGQGNNGGNGKSGGNTGGGGGGGGAGGVGDSGNLAGVGGIGISNSITGSPTYYGGGGGGGRWSVGSEGVANIRLGGGGRGAGSCGSNPAVAGTANTGGGGGGAPAGCQKTGAAGGSGVVIVSY
jgi:hypothetical protein